MTEVYTQISGLLKFKGGSDVSTPTYKTHMNSVKAGTGHSKQFDIE